MPNILNVTLDTTKTPWAVNVDDANNANHVSQSSIAQTITWQLTGNAFSGSFMPLSNANNPGFSWTGTEPPAGIFRNPTVNGSQFTISDLNSSTSATGTWTYKLWINVGGTLYTTINTSIEGTNTNPIIINR